MSFLCEFDRVHSRFILMLEQSLERWGLTASQFRVLNTLYSNPKIRPKDLALKLEIDVAAATRLIDRLVQKNMVDRIRCEDDRRVCYISIHSDFLDEIQSISEHIQRVENAFVSDIPKNEQEIFLKAIKRLAEIKKLRSGDLGQSVIF